VKPAIPVDLVGLSSAAKADSAGPTIAPTSTAVAINQGKTGNEVAESSKISTAQVEKPVLSKEPTGDVKTTPSVGETAPPSVTAITVVPAAASITESTLSKAPGSSTSAAAVTKTKPAVEVAAKPAGVATSTPMSTAAPVSAKPTVVKAPALLPPANISGAKAAPAVVANAAVTVAPRKAPVAVVTSGVTTPPTTAAPQKLVPPLVIASTLPGFKNTKKPPGKTLSVNHKERYLPICYR